MRARVSAQHPPIAGPAPRGCQCAAWASPRASPRPPRALCCSPNRCGGFFLNLHIKKWDLGFHFDSKVDVDEAGVVFMGCFGAVGLVRTFRFVNPFNQTKWDVVTRPGDMVIFHSDCYRIMHGSLPLECDGPFYSVTMRRSDGCGYIMGGKRGSSAVAAEAAAKRFKQGTHEGASSD